jgi:acetyl-CoA carboxylase carboxyltransferase component
MAEKALTKRDLEQTFKGFEKRQDEKMKTLEKRVIDQFHIISEGLIDQIKLLAEGHAGIIDRLNRMEKENERQHQETRSIVKLSFTELDRRLTDLETQMKEIREWKKQVEGRLQI